MHMNLLLQTVLNIYEKYQLRHFLWRNKIARNLLQNDWQIYPKSRLNDTKVHIYKPWHYPSTLRKSYQYFCQFLSARTS